MNSAAKLVTLLLLCALPLAGIGPPAQAKPVTTKATPSATISRCDKESQSLTLVTLQSSTLRSDKLQQRYIGQYLDKDSGNWKAFSSTKWREIANESPTVRSSTDFTIAKGHGHTYRYRVQFRWLSNSKSVTVPRLTKSLTSPVEGKAHCRL